MVIGFLMVLMASVGAAEPAKARITQLVGKVEVRSREAASWRPARLGMMVKESWDIRSYVESEAEVTFENGTIVKIGENSVVTLSRHMVDEKSGASHSTVKIMTGKVWANVKKLTETQSKFDFETPTAVASIRGTRLGIDVVRRRTFIDVYEGVVAVRRKNGTASIKVTANTRAIVERGERNIAVVDFKNLQKEQKGKGAETPPHDPFTNKDTVSAPGDSSSPVNDTLQQDSGIDGNLFQVSFPQPGAVVEESPFTLRGKAVTGAAVTVAGKPVELEADGNFTQLIELQPGANTVSIAAELNGKRQNAEITCDYHIPLQLNVANIENGMEVRSKSIVLDIVISEGAHYSVNGVEGTREVLLNEGKNVITIEAWDDYNNRTSQQYEVIFKQKKGFTLSVVAPDNGSTVSEPLIQVTGSTVSAANVFVNDMQVPVGPDGFFSARIPIPDEPYVYSVEIRAEYEGKELTEVRTVTYEPQKEKLFLECTSPVAGQVVSSRTLRIAGKTSPRASVTANGMPVSVSGNGTYNREIALTERDIGSYIVEVTAQNENEEVNKTITVEVSGKSPQINVNAPICQFSLQGQQATTQNSAPIQLLDRTPDEELTLKITNNGSTENIITEPGRTEYLLLNEGENVYSIQAFDRAGNASQMINGKIYCLPGPLIILLNEPSSNPMVYEGLPPALHPGYTTSEEPIDVEVEIDDGIGNVPMSIRHCKVIGNGQTVLLRNNNDYIFVGKVNVRRGTNRFSIQVEDMTGRVEISRFSVIVR